eukprot:6176924-Pleurochrysis_carterae.AAC.2
MHARSLGTLPFPVSASPSRTLETFGSVGLAIDHLENLLLHGCANRVAARPVVAGAAALGVLVDVLLRRQAEENVRAGEGWRRGVRGVYAKRRELDCLNTDRFLDAHRKQLDSALSSQRDFIRLPADLRRSSRNLSRVVLRVPHMPLHVTRRKSRMEHGAMALSRRSRALLSGPCCVFIALSASSTLSPTCSLCLENTMLLPNALTHP